MYMWRKPFYVFVEVPRRFYSRGRRSCPPRWTVFIIRFLIGHGVFRLINVSEDATVMDLMWLESRVETRVGDRCCISPERREFDVAERVEDRFLNANFGG